MPMPGVPPASHNALAISFMNLLTALCYTSAGFQPARRVELPEIAARDKARSALLCRASSERFMQIKVTAADAHYRSADETLMIKHINSCRRAASEARQQRRRCSPS